MRNLSVTKKRSSRRSSKAKRKSSNRRVKRSNKRSRVARRSNKRSRKRRGSKRQSGGSTPGETDPTLREKILKLYDPKDPYSLGEVRRALEKEPSPAAPQDIIETLVWSSWDGYEVPAILKKGPLVQRRKLLDAGFDRSDINAVLIRVHSINISEGLNSKIWGDDEDSEEE